MPAAGLGIGNRGEHIVNCASLPANWWKGEHSHGHVARKCSIAEDTCIKRLLRFGGEEAKGG